MVVDELDKLVEAYEGCNTVAFADLSTRMVLVTNSMSTMPREAIDRVCVQAAVTLGGDGKTPVGETPATLALVADKSSVHLFLRATDEPNDVLCCVCSTNVDVEGLMAQAKECLSRISTNDAG